MLQHTPVSRRLKRKNISAALLLLTASVPVMAENNVSIYGIIDAGLLYQSKADPTGQGSRSYPTDINSRRHRRSRRRPPSPGAQPETHPRSLPAIAWS